MADSKTESKLSWQIELAKALAWPVFALFVIICFWSSLHNAANAVAIALRASEAITIGELSIRVGKNDIRPSPQVQAAITGLSSAAIKKLFELKPDIVYPAPPDPAAQDANAELLRANLARPLTSNELAASSNRMGLKFVYGIVLTPLGSSVKSYIESVILEVIKQT
jgi:hypothetical protein